MNVALAQLIEKHVPALRADGEKLIEILHSQPCDIQAAQALAHRLKGASGSLGFLQFSQSCLEIEARCKILALSDKAEWLGDWEAQFAIIRQLSPLDSELYQGQNP